MRRKRSDGQDTRHRLLEAAGAIFAHKGFWQASLAEICRTAGANIAAANYHFNSKEELYLAAWRHAQERMLKLYPPDGGVPEGASAEARLRGRILAIVRRMFDPHGHAFAIVQKESAFPTGLLTDALRDTVRPLREAFLALVRELIGPGVPEADVVLCLQSILAQCFSIRMYERAGGHTPAAKSTAASAHRKPPVPAREETIEAVANHVTSFSLGGILRLRREAATRAPKRRRPSRTRTTRQKDGRS
ncbi:MAG: TetR/AcrR family transcriptional regulator [Planctomycetota bacterium]